MSIQSLQHLISEARGLANDHPCLSFGHAWQHDGGRACPHDLTPNCSQPVYRCERCGEWDYGKKGGPGHRHCAVECRDRDVGGWSK